MKRLMFISFILVFLTPQLYAGNRGYFRSRRNKADKKDTMLIQQRRRELIEIKPVVVGEDDIIKVDVLLHPELSGTFQISQFGTISLPLTGEEVLVSGLTKEGIRKKLKKVLSKYVEEPVIVVDILSYSSKQVIIMGEVSMPGTYPLGGKSVSYGHYGAFRFTGRIRTVKDLIMAAGMPTKNAALRRVLVITPSYVGKPTVKRVDMYRVLFKGYYQDDVLLRPGDIVYVPTKALPYVAEQVGSIVSPILSPVTRVETLRTTVESAGK